MLSRGQALQRFDYKNEEERAEFFFNIYAHALSLGCKIQGRGTLAEVLDVYNSDEDITIDVLACVNKGILVLTGVDVVAGRLENIYKGYTSIAVGDTAALKEWLRATLKSKQAPYFESKKGDVRLYGNYVNFEKESWDDLLERISLYLSSGGWDLDVKQGDNKGVIMVKLQRV